MFIMHMPENFKIGDTAACRINGEPTQLTWHTPDTLVIGVGDIRHIVKMHVFDGLRCFICGDAGKGQFLVAEVYGEGFTIVSEE